MQATNRVVTVERRDRQSTLGLHRQLVEIVAIVAENTFTNYLNEVAKTDVDPSVVDAAAVAARAAGSARCR